MADTYELMVMNMARGAERDAAFLAHCTALVDGTRMRGFSAELQLATDVVIAVADGE